MINFEDMTITLGQNQGVIDHFETWWVVPTLGMFQTIEQVKERLKEIDLPISLIKPVTAAVCLTGLYEVIL